MASLPVVRNLLLFGVAYFAGAELGHLLAFPGDFAAFWPPAGLMIAALLNSKTQRWPALCLIAILANLASDLVHGVAPHLSLVFASANLIEAIVSVLLIHELAGRPFILDRSRSVIALLVVPMAVTAPVGALIGATAASFAFDKRLIPCMINWWAGDVMGVAVFAPLAIAIMTDRGKFFRNFSPIRLLEGAIALGALAVITQMVFSKLDHPVSYLAVPTMLWIAFRFEIGGIAISLAILVLPIVWNTIQGNGPFVGDYAETTRILLLQGYMGVYAITFLLLATVVRQRRRIANEIHLSETRYRDLFENVSDMVHSIAPDGSVIFANRAWRDALGYTEEDLKTLNLFSVIHEDEIERCRSLLQRMTAGEDIGRIETKFVTKEGKIIAVEGQSNCRVENGIAVCTRAIFRDVTENRQQMRQLELARRELQETAAKLSRVATTDALTSVHNRASFQKRLEEEISRARRYATPLSLLMIDVDHFKQYNDTLGHAEGDKALSMVAKLLRDIARGTDIVARYGGEEFSVILPHTDVEGAMAVAERARRVIEEHGWTKRAVTASIGAATLGDSDIDGMKMIKQADAAMYRSKRTGRNRSVHAKLLLDDENDDPTKLFALFDDPVASAV